MSKLPPQAERPRVAVITPYFKEGVAILRQCHDSVAGQSYHCTHVMVADGFPQAEVDQWAVDHVVLPRPHHDLGSTPRLIGCYHAIGLNFDAVAFLDADNWYRRDHIECLVSLLEESQAGLVSSGRVLCRPDGSIMRDCPLTDPERFIDTNCMMVSRPGFPVLAQWVLMPAYGHLIGDRIMLHHFKESGIRRAHSALPTLFYRCGKEGIYHFLQEPVPEGVSSPPNYKDSFDKWLAERFPPLT